MGAEDAASRRAPGARAREYGVRVKVAAWAGLTCVQVFAACVLRVSQRGGVYAFSPQSSLVMSEGIKVLLSGAFLVWDARARAMSPWRLFVRESSARLVAHMFCLAAIYCFNNALMFWLFARADPGSITLIKSGGTIVSAVLLYFWRRFRLSVARWMVILVQMLGLIVAQYDSCIGRAHLAAPVYAVLFVSLFNSSMANVWNEHVVKNFDSASLATKNVHLYMFGAALNLAAFCYTRATSGGSPRFLEGYTTSSALVVASNALMGLAMNVVYKYADALVKNMATTSTTAALLALSALFFQGRRDAMVPAGAAVVLLGTLLYFSLGLSEQRACALRLRLQRAEGAARAGGEGARRA